MAISDGTPTTDYTDPSTIDVDEVCANINHAFNVRGDSWTDQLSWPNVTVKALADEIADLRSRPLARDRAATATEAYALGITQAALEHERNRGSAFELSSVAAVYGCDGVVTGELTVDIGGRSFIVTVTDATADEDGTIEVTY